MGVRDSAGDLVRRWADGREERASLADPPLDGVEGDTCRARFCSCSCGRRGHAGGAHVCSCGGSWSGPAGDETVRRLPSVASLEDFLPEGFDPEAFARALRLGFDPFMAAICASPPVRAERGAIEYRQE